MPTSLKWIAAILGSIVALSQGVAAQEEGHHQPPPGRLARQAGGVARPVLRAGARLRKDARYRMTAAAYSALLMRASEKPRARARG